MLAADASLEITRALLHADFGVTWELQRGQLVPPVANRANYIHWLEDLLRLSSPDKPAQTCGEAWPTNCLQRQSCLSLLGARCFTQVSRVGVHLWMVRCMKVSGRKACCVSTAVFELGPDDSRPHSGRCQILDEQERPLQRRQTECQELQWACYMLDWQRLSQSVALLSHQAGEFPVHL